MKFKITVFILIALTIALPAFSGENDGWFKISSFSTSVEDQVPNVKHNISIACRKLDGYIINGKTLFSFNDAVGEGSIANGYQNGLVMYRGSVKMEPGGGLCQVSSTLFNAFIMAGLAIRERYRHYQPVTYVPPGLDATIKYGKKDLKIKNIYSFPVRIRASVNDKSLLIVLEATVQSNTRYEITTETEDVPLPLGTDGDEIRQGFSVEVYRKKFSGTKCVETFLLYKDFYPPVRNR